MQTRLDVLADVNGLGKVVEVISDFYTELNQLKKGGATLISPRDEAYARIATVGRENIGKNYGTITSAGFEYVKNQLPILRLNSRLLNPKLAKKAVEANKSGNYFHTDSTKEYEQSLSIAEKEEKQGKVPKDRSVIVLPSRETLSISNQSNWDIYEMILKDQAEKYFKLNDETINIFPLDKTVVDSQNGTILTQLWFRDLGYRSDFVGDVRDFSDSHRDRGVMRATEGSEATQKFSKINLPYTQKEINRELKRIDKIRTGNLRMSDLESEVGKIKEFLDRLKQ